MEDLEGMEHGLVSVASNSIAFLSDGAVCVGTHCHWSHLTDPTGKMETRPDMRHQSTGSHEAVSRQDVSLSVGSCSWIEVKVK